MYFLFLATCDSLFVTTTNLSYIFMLVSIRVKSTYAYGIHHAGMGPYTPMVIFYDTVCLSLNIVPHASMVRL